MAEFPRPGVRVTQNFRTTSPTFTRPALPACIVGPCRQVVEGVQDDGTFNPDAAITLPAIAPATWRSSPFEYTSIGGKSLFLEINNAAAEDVVFSTGPNLTAAVVAAEFNAAGIVGVEAVVESRPGNDQRVVFRTTSTGDNASIRIAAGTHADILTAFGFTLGYTFVGRAGYVNYNAVVLGRENYPDPRGNIDDLTIDYETVRVFVNNGAGVPREASRTSAFLDGATSAVSVQDDGDSDNLSPYLNFANAGFKSEAAAITGTVVWSGLTYPAAFGTNTLILEVTGGITVTVTFASPGNAAAAIAAVNSALGVNGTAVLNGGGFPVLTTAATGGGAYIKVTGGTINHATIGLPLGTYDMGKPGPATAKGTANITTLTYATDVQGRVLRMSVNKQPFQTIVFGTGVTNASTLIAALEALWGNLDAQLAGDNTLFLQAEDLIGRESSIHIDKTASTGALLTALGLTGGGAPFNSTEIVEGPAYAVAVGDEVWVDGIRLGEVTEVVAGVNNRLRIDSEQLLSFTGSTWTIMAMGLDNDLPTATRPGSELYVDPTSGTLYVNGGLFRSSGGTVVQAGPLPLYVAYTALRLDVTAASDDFTQLAFGSTTELEAALSPIDPQNPLGLGMYVALLNSPQVLTYGLGVDEAPASVPDGTLDAYVRAFGLLESKAVYGIAPLTHDVDVAAVALAHAEAMSDPDISLERYVIWNPSRPTRRASTLVASTQLGNVSGVPTSVVNSGIAALQAMLAALGKPGPSYTYADGVYVEFENDTNKYLVASVSSGNLTIFAGPFTSGQNLDGFFYNAGGSPVFTTVKIDVPMSIQIRGAALASRDEEAAAYAAIPPQFASRRMVVTAPDKARMTIDGLEQIVEGYYLNCAVVGLRAGSAPQRPLSNTVVAGFTGLVGSADRYSERQFRIMGGGGLWIFQQDDPSVAAAPRIRHQLTSDMSTIEQREDNIRTALDFAAIFFRQLLTNFTGRYVLTTGITESVSVTVSGGARLLVEQGVFLKLDITKLSPNADNPTKLDIDGTAKAPYPLNDIDFTLTV